MLRMDGCAGFQTLKPQQSGLLTRGGQNGKMQGEVERYIKGVGDGGGETSRGKADRGVMLEGSGGGGRGKREEAGVRDSQHPAEVFNDSWTHSSDISRPPSATHTHTKKHVEAQKLKPKSCAPPCLCYINAF